MHSLYFVIVPRDRAEIEDEAIKIAENFLNNNGFVGDGLYGHGKADWYEVGGRWSGELLSLLGWYPKVIGEINTMLKEKYPTLDSGVAGVFYGDVEKEKLKIPAVADIKKMWEKLAPIGYKDCPCPLIRDSHVAISNVIGGVDVGLVGANQWDNAMIMTPTMFKRLQERYKSIDPDLNEVEIVDTEESQEYTITNIPKEKVIGNWVVVVDYHS